MKSFLYLTLFLTFLAITACETSQQTTSSKTPKLTPNYKGTIQPGAWNRNFYIDSTGQRVTYNMYFPSSYTLGDAAKTIILLNCIDNRTLRDWEVRTNVAQLAEKYNYVLVAPYTSHSTFSTKYFPESVDKWNPVPGTPFIAEHFIPHIQKEFALAANRDLTYIFGIGYGGRGAVMVGAIYPHLVKNIASIDGFYELRMMAQFSAVRNIYGNITNHPERYRNEDDLLEFAKGLKDSRLIIIHTAKNHHHDVAQARLMGITMRSLARKNPGKYEMKYIEDPGQRPGWPFWSTQTDTVFEFFNKSK